MERSIPGHTVPPQAYLEPKSDIKTTASSRGGFFMIHPETWAVACDLGINEAVSYLTLACGTGRDNKTTKWSVQALHMYTGLAWNRGTDAINRLWKAGLIWFMPDYTPKLPHYKITSPEEALECYRAMLATVSEDARQALTILRTTQQCENTDDGAIDELKQAGFLIRTDDDRFVPLEPPRPTRSEPIWLPNALVTGATTATNPPLRRLRQSGDIRALRFLVSLYGVQNLRDDGGVSPAVLKQVFERRLVKAWAGYNIWAFRPGEYVFQAEENGQIVRHVYSKTASDDMDAFWASHDLLIRLKLLSYVPHVWDHSPDSGGEIVYPYGDPSFGGETVEIRIGKAAYNAAMRACAAAKMRAPLPEGFRCLCAIRATMPNVCMVGVARLHYRPHTSRTGAWMTDLQLNATDTIAELEAIAPYRAALSPVDSQGEET